MALLRTDTLHRPKSDDSGQPSSRPVLMYQPLDNLDCICYHELLPVHDQRLYFHDGALHNFKSVHDRYQRTRNLNSHDHLQYLRNHRELQVI